MSGVRGAEGEGRRAWTARESSPTRPRRSARSKIDRGEEEEESALEEEGGEVIKREASR